MHTVCDTPTPLCHWHTLRGCETVDREGERVAVGAGGCRHSVKGMQETYLLDV